jgi:hypothetical protein
MPRYSGGLWLAVTSTPAAQRRRRTARHATGVATAPRERSTATPSASIADEASSAARPARKRVSWTTSTGAPGRVSAA